MIFPLKCLGITDFGKKKYWCGWILKFVWYTILFHLIEFCHDMMSWTSESIISNFCYGKEATTAFQVLDEMSIKIPGPKSAFKKDQESHKNESLRPVFAVTRFHILIERRSGA